MIKIARLKNFDWLAVVFYPLAVILMESFWVAPWLNWVGVWPLFSETRPILSLASVVIIIVVSLVITRIFTTKQWSLLKIRFIIIGGGLLTMLLVLAVEYNDGYTFLSGGWFAHIGQVLGNTFSHAGTVSVAIPAIVYLWWRGIMLGQSTSYFKDIYRSFLIGMFALIALIIFWQISTSSGRIPDPGSGIVIDVICFFFFGLLAIAVSHLYTMRQTMPKEEAKLTSMWRWVPIMIGVIGVMIIIGFGVASAMSPEFIDAVGHGANVVFGFLAKMFEYIAYPIIYLGQGLVWLLYWFIGLLSGSQQEQGAVSGNLTSQLFPETGTIEISPTVTSIIKWTVFAIIIALVIFFLARAISRYRARHDKEEYEEVRESLFSWRGLRDDLKEFFRSMRRRRPPKVPAYQFEETGRLDVREIYRHMQWEAKNSGLPRHRHETTEEYADRIEHIMPDSIKPLNSLTDIYENVRYGEKAASAEKEDKANSIWKTLKAMIRKLRGT